MNMKEQELRLIAELMKNSRRSDRELAKAIGVSQPTVSRIIGKLEKEGIIKEYTMIPDFSKLGYDLMAVFMYKLKALPPEELEELYKASWKLRKQGHLPFLLVMDGQGFGKNLIVISLHRDYSEYASYLQSLKETAGSKAKAYENLNSVEGFLIDLKYKQHYQPITFSRVAKDLQAVENKKKE
jgi:DNA-binding Lrp family transcriptional regulator